MEMTLDKNGSDHGKKSQWPLWKMAFLGQINLKWQWSWIKWLTLNKMTMILDICRWPWTLSMTLDIVDDLGQIWLLWTKNENDLRHFAYQNSFMVIDHDQFYGIVLHILKIFKIFYPIRAWSCTDPPRTFLTVRLKRWGNAVNARRGRTKVIRSQEERDHRGVSLVSTAQLSLVTIGHTSDIIFKCIHHMILGWTNKLIQLLHNKEEMLGYWSADNFVMCSKECLSNSPPPL